MVLEALVRYGAFSGSDDQVLGDLTLFVALLCGCIVIGHLLEESQWINLSITALIIGLCTGGIILLTTKGKSSRLLEFDEQLFFIYVIPPIIFNAGFQVKKKHFFRNLGTIMLFGVLGTLISFGIISFGAVELLGKLDTGFLELRDYLAIGAIFSATDSVCTLQVLNQDETPLLYSLVFGEGVVNDATSVVLFNAIQKFDLSNINSRVALSFTGNFLYLFAASTVLGVLVGLLSAYIIKKMYNGRNSTNCDVALMILMAYLSYVMAELFDLSGILTVFLCGIVMSHYTWHNVTDDSKVTTRHAFATMSFIAETFIFLYVGMDALDIEKWRFVSHSPGKSVAVSSVVFALVLVGRACFVIPLSMLSNFWTSKHDKISFKHMVTIWWAGLMRGAVSMALAYNQFMKSGHSQVMGNALMITSTIAIVLFSTMVFGLLTKPLIRYLIPPSQHFNSMSSSEFSFALPLLSGIEDDVPRIRSLTVLLKRPAQAIMYFWSTFDDAFMRRVFGGRESMLDTTRK
ncbi:hypothetical protein K7X08_005849 [Anisodus acutangulus]|uniref:Cation/H+ exchanger transmembrane domain-containing protein n=1 Tax=Anisodus acutangulus TaxID=402998 RepID=A0A9Q1LVF0_9SOLA|nr:hypothetical protein K7X08_005849 [Anisodus acutangulus]